MKHQPTDEELDRLLGGHPELAVTEKEALFERIFERTQATGETGTRPIWRWAFAFAAALLLLVPAVYFSSRRTETEFAVRGETLAPTFSVSCIADGHPAPCTQGAKLVFQVKPSGWVAFAALAEGPDGSTVWFFPTGEQLSVDLQRIDASGVLELAPVIDGPSGNYTLHGVFSKRPLTQAEVRAALSGPAPQDISTVVRPLEVR